jgi:hypothetical protein
MVVSLTKELILAPSQNTHAFFLVGIKDYTLDLYFVAKLKIDRIFYTIAT